MTGIDHERHGQPDYHPLSFDADLIRLGMDQISCAQHQVFMDPLDILTGAILPAHHGAPIQLKRHQNTLQEADIGYQGNYDCHHFDRGVQSVVSITALAENFFRYTLYLNSMFPIFIKVLSWPVCFLRGNSNSGIIVLDGHRHILGQVYTRLT